MWERRKQNHRPQTRHTMGPQSISRRLTSNRFVTVSKELPRRAVHHQGENRRRDTGIWKKAQQTPPSPGDQGQGLCHDYSDVTKPMLQDVNRGTSFLWFVKPQSNPV